MEWRSARAGEGGGVTMTPVCHVLLPWSTVGVASGDCVCVLFYYYRCRGECKRGESYGLLVAGTREKIRCLIFIRYEKQLLVLLLLQPSSESARDC